ncbi:unnamed protein product [Penicillium roqueforti FM164]|uniref:Genomic scaffold, ProqFM164S01 n=1 Tax=Penicillium roqueforti (strain FM164) TaxID=1365484 RepID=W6PQ67_PENRF|nr:unnamed protein product [Penicillium roqueforti FM164]
MGASFGFRLLGNMANQKEVRTWVLESRSFESRSSDLDTRLMLKVWGIDKRSRSR